MKTPLKFSQYLFIQLDELIFIAILLIAYNLGPQMLSIDSDLGRHLTIGNYIISNAAIPNVDILSYTKPDESRPPYEWGSQILMALADRYFGLDGVILLFAFLIAATFAFVYSNSVKHSQLPILSFLLVIIGMAASSIHWLPRPHIVTFLFLAIWIDQLEKARSSKNSSLAIFPIIMLIWANMHGGFIFGLLAWVAYFAGAAWEKITTSNGDESGLYRFLKIGLYSIPASFITPDGWGNWKALLGNNSAYILRNTQETRPADFSLPETWPFLLLLLLAIIIFFLAKNKIHAGRGFLLAGMAVMGLYMARNIPLFGIVSVPILANAAQGIASFFPAWSKIEENMQILLGRFRKGLWSTIVVVFILANIILQRSNKISANQFNAVVFPVAAVDWLEKNPQLGNMFNEFNWGGYLEMRLWPQRVFLDSQTDFYGESLVREYQQVISADTGWQDVVDKYNIQWVLIGKTSPLAIQLNSQTDSWALLYSDKVAAIYKQK